MRLQKQVFVHTWLSRAYLALARLSCLICDVSRIIERPWIRQYGGQTIPEASVRRAHPT